MKKFVLCFFMLILCAVSASASQPEIDELRTHFRSEIDEVEGIKWIYDKATPKTWDSNVFYVYLGQKDENVWARLIAGFVKEEWVFFREIIINVDGERYSIDFKSRDKKKDVVRGNVIFEFIDIPAKSYVDMLKHISTSKKTIIRYQGDTYRYDVTISQKQKGALKRILRYYELISNRG